MHRITVNDFHVLFKFQLSKTRCENKVDTSLTGIDIFSDEEVTKIEERAVRFGLGEKKLFSTLKIYKDLYVR